MVTDKHDDITIIKAENGDYIFHRLKKTKDKQDSDLTEEKGHYLIFRSDKDKNWKVSDQKETFQNGEDYSNDLNGIMTTTELIETTTTLKVESLKDREINGIYKYPTNCQSEDCLYYVEWGSTDDKVTFLIIARNKSSINIGLAKSEDKV